MNCNLEIESFIIMDEGAILFKSSCFLKFEKKTKLDFFTMTDMNFAYNPNQ